MQTIKTIIGTTIVLAILVVVAGLAYMYSGAYNMAATAPHNALTQWVINTTREHSVKAHAQGIDAPALDGEQMTRTGFTHYRENCVRCHGAPGVEAFEGAEDMYPQPPKLDHAAEEMSPAALFRVIKHGLKMSGMPAWGPTHSDDKIWAMVAFLQQLPDMTPAEYQKLNAEIDPEAHEHSHEHESAHEEDSG